MQTNFNFIFENTPFYYRDQMMNVFNNLEELKKYFFDFYQHYKKFDIFFSPLSNKRMNGKKVKNYTELHKYSVKLSDHYKLLLSTGMNIFDVCLNDFNVREIKPK